MAFGYATSARLAGGSADGSRDPEVRDRWVRDVVERAVARQDEGVDGGATAEVPSRLVRAAVEADDAVPARLQRARQAVLIRPAYVTLTHVSDRGATVLGRCRHHVS